MIFKAMTTTERDRIKQEVWRWRFALFPMRLQNEHTAIRVWGWYEVRGNNDFTDYRIDGQIFHYTFNPEH